MTMHLKANFGKPLEREYEAWIVAGIERHFRAIGIPLSIWAIGPGEEVVWPADEKLYVDSKIVGLQFKQAKLAKGAASPDALHWSLHQPPAQFQRVLSNSEIFYCLPTFINRRVRDEALHHCLFWRPDATKPQDKNVWYANTRARTPYNEVAHGMRWGLFSEQLFQCPIGKKVTTATEAQAVINRIQSHVDQEQLSSNTPGGRNYGESRGEAGAGLYLLAFPLEG